MRRSMLLASFGAVALLVGGSGAPSLAGHAAAPVVGNASVTGAYAFSTSFHDPISGQEGNSAGTFVFDGAGGLSGVYSQNSRCNGCGGQATVDRASITGSYTIYADGSATVDSCIAIAGTSVRALFQGAFSSKFTSLRFVQTALGTCGGTSGDPLNDNHGTAEKL